MSFAALICLSLLYFTATNGEEMHQKDAHKRYRRGLVDLNKMVMAITGKSGLSFLDYGNWCGRGGKGNTVDRIDGCCQNHDLCYSEIMQTFCQNSKTRDIYLNRYEWTKTDSGKASCGDENTDPCKTAICMCDAIVTNCLLLNMEFYDENNVKRKSPPIKRKRPKYFMRNI